VSRIKRAVTGYKHGVVLHRGFPDSRPLALRLRTLGASARPSGGAFGPGGEGHLRLCFARDPEQIAEATRRMARWLKS
jgi:bifunctional pyridoxal-dependent enzyme with beta-cystathionase and maltose regulon repressor activities